MKHPSYLLDRNWWSFLWRYLRGRTPWDTNITPPEVMQFLKDTAPGRALDIGCGTGTNAIALATHGWQVMGVDFAFKAIRRARRKAAKAGVAIDFRRADVSALSHIALLFDYALDIGCLHSLGDGQRPGYALELKRLLKPGGTYMLYAWLPRIRNGVRRGIAPEEVRTLLAPAFRNDRTVIGKEGEAPTAWYWFTRK